MHFSNKILYTLLILIMSVLGCTYRQPLPEEKWKYEQLIQEVKKGKIEKVSITADREIAIVKAKQDSNLKQVALTNDPNLIEILTQNQVDISILPSK